MKHSYSLVYDEIKEEDPERFERAMRMSPENFDYLLSLVEPLIARQDTRMRRAIPAHHRLMYTLRYLASGANFFLLSELFRVSEQLIADDIPRVRALFLLCFIFDLRKLPSASKRKEHI